MYVTNCTGCTPDMANTGRWDSSERRVGRAPWVPCGGHSCVSLHGCRVGGRRCLTHPVPTQEWHEPLTQGEFKLPLFAAGYVWSNKQLCVSHWLTNIHGIDDSKWTHHKTPLYGSSSPKEVSWGIKK